MTKSKKRKSRTKKSHPRWMYIALLSVIAVCLGVIIALIPDTFSDTGGVTEPSVQEPATTAEQPEPVQPDRGPDEMREVSSPGAEAPPRAMIYLVIDDVGNNISQVKPFLDFQGRMTFAVMPDRPYTTSSAELIGGAGFEVIMHQPMEATGGEDPGPAAVYTSLSPGEIHDLLARNFEGIPGAVGMNNHMGSKVTADSETMKEILSFLSQRGMFFLDSVTTSESVARVAAEAEGVPYAYRNALFLDNDQSVQAIVEKLDAGLEKARTEGYAVLIGHIWNENLPVVLKERYESIVDDGFAFGYLSQLYDGRTGG